MHFFGRNISSSIDFVFLAELNEAGLEYCRGRACVYQVTIKLCLRLLDRLLIIIIIII